MMIDVGFANSAAIRLSLARGLAKETLHRAELDETRGPRIFAELQAMRPNAKSRRRTLARLKRWPGVVRTALRDGETTATIVFRNTREVEYRTGDAAHFRETALVYTRVEAIGEGECRGYTIARLTFCAHALERYVERTCCDLSNILRLVDVEAVKALSQVVGNLVIRDGDDEFLTSPHGVWAGGLDRTGLEPEWGLVAREPDAGVTVFSVRTFLGENQMRPLLLYKRYVDASRQDVA